MTSVSYDFSFDYGYDADGALRPLLRLLVSNVAEPSNAVEIDAALDSGAERSLLNGRIGEALGIDVLRGPELSFSTMAGGLLPATLHRVRISHSDLGTLSWSLLSAPWRSNGTCSVGISSISSRSGFASTS